MKLSKSFARLVPGTHKSEVQHDRSLQRKRSSLDNLIIPRRTRLPSSKVSQVEPIDLQIAMNLLNAQAHALPATRSSTAASISEGTRESCDVSATESDGPQTLSQSSGSFWFRNDTRNGSFAGDERHLNGGEDHHSTLVARKQSSSSSSGRWEHHGLGMTYDGPNDFASEESSLTSLTLPSINDSAIDVLRAGPAESAEKYNTLAALHGLSQSDVIQDHVRKQVHRIAETQPAKQSHLSIFKNLVTTKGHHKKIPRRTTSSQSLKAKRPWSMSKGRVEGEIFQCTSLEELFRLGGCSTLKLPANFSPIETLLIPVSLAATARNIVENGPAILGIFREGGSVLSIHKLCDYYNNLYQSHASAEDSSRVQYTIGANDLPSGIPCTIPDAASVFKKVVLNLPGGLLGSLELLKALGEIAQLFQGDAERSRPKASKLRARLIALALSCVSSDERFSVISATLGLFTWLGHAKQISMDGANMSYESLSTILSPLLVGDELNIEKEGRRAAVIEPQPDNLEFLNLLTGDSAAMARAHQNTQDGAKIALMLLLEWKEVVKHLRCLAASAATALREKEEEERLANAESMYTLDPTRLAQGRQTSDGSAGPAIREPKPRNKKGFLQPSKAITSSSSSTSRTPKRSSIPSSKSVTSLAPGPRQPAPPPGFVRLPDGTGGFVNCPAVHGLSDGAKTRGRTTPLKKAAKSDPLFFTSLEPESTYSISGQQQQERIPSDPALPQSLVRDAQKQQRNRQLCGVENQHCTETHKHPKTGPTYKTSDQPEYGYYDEDYNTEDRMSDYGALLPTELSHSEGSHYDEDEEAEEYWRSQSVLQTFEKLKEIKADVARSKHYQQQPTAFNFHADQQGEGLSNPAGSKFRARGSDGPLMGRNGHSTQSSLDIAEFARAHHFAAFGSVNNRHQAPTRSSNLRTTSDFHETKVKKVSSLHITTKAGSETGAMGTDVQPMGRRSQDSERPQSSHSLSQTANSVAGSQSGSVRLLAQRFDQPLQGHYVPGWAKPKSGASLEPKLATSKPAMKGEPSLTITSESNTSPPLVQDPSDMPTPRARTKSMIPRPLSDVGRPRKKGERRSSRSPSPVKIPTPVTAVRQRPPPFNIFTDDPYEQMMTGALDPFDVRIREPLSPTQGSSPLIYPEDPPLARMVKSSTGLIKSVTTPIISSLSSMMNSNQETSDSFRLRPISIDSNLLLAHKDTDSQPSRRRHSALQNGDEYSPSAYSTQSGDRSSNVSRRVPKSMTTGNISLLFQENERLRTENERQTKMLEDYRRREKEAEESKRHSELKLRPKTEVEDAEDGVRALKILKVKYDEWTLVREARMLQYQHIFHGGREVNVSVASFTTQELIDGSGWDVESQGPYPKPPNKADQEKEIEAKFFVKGLSPYYICDTKAEEMLERKNLAQWIKMALAKRQRAREDAGIVFNEEEELEAFKEKMESVKEWDRQRQIKKRESEEWWERLTPEEKKKYAARYTRSTFRPRTKQEYGNEELQGVTEEERNKRAKQKFEKLLVDEFGADEAGATKRKWFGIRKGSRTKCNGESPEERKASGGRVKGMAKLFGGGGGRGS